MVHFENAIITYVKVDIKEASFPIMFICMLVQVGLHNMCSIVRTRLLC